MPVAPIQRQVKAAELPPERLAGNANLTEPEKVAEASRQFEAVLLRQILENTQKPVIKSALNTDSTARSIYRDLISTNLAESISKSGEFGLAKTFEQQLTRQPGVAQKRGKSPTLAPARSEAKPAAASPAPVRPPHWPFAETFRLYEARQQKPAALRGAPAGALRPMFPARKNLALPSAPFHGKDFPATVPSPATTLGPNPGAQASKRLRATAPAHGATLLLFKP